MRGRVGQCSPVDGGIVQLSGFAKSQSEKDRAGQIARGVKGVTEVRNSLIVKSLGARVLTGLRGDTVIPKQTGASTAYWIAEGDSLTDSNASYASVRLEPKHVGALTGLSRQLIQQSNPAIEQLVRDDFAAVVSLAVD